MDISDKFWSKDPKVLYRQDRIIEFYISSDMTTSEKLNAITRFGVYVSVILSIYFKNYKYLLIGILIGLATLFLFSNLQEKKQEQVGVEEFSNYTAPEEFKQTILEPTVDNPFMNPSVLEKSKNRAMDYSEKNTETLAIKKDMTDKFNYNLYQDVSDTYGTNTSSRQFYTVPDNDTSGDFKNFLFGSMKSAKENTYNSFKNLYEPLASKRR